jgi:hypothetical protein
LTQDSDCLLVQVTVSQGGTDIKLCKSTQAGTSSFPLALIVTIGSVKKVDYAFFLQYFPKKIVQMLFAEIAAFFRVSNKVIPSKRFYLDAPLLDRTSRVPMTFCPGNNVFPLLLFLEAGVGVKYHNPVRPQDIKGRA